MAEMRHVVKDSVFTCLFGQIEYALELYKTLHPEDTDVAAEDCEIITLENVLTVNQYNDFGLQVRDILILLLEAQSIFSPNVVLRIFLYLAETYKRHVEEHKLNLYGTAPVKIPRPELYVVYTGPRTDVPKTLHLSELYDGDGAGSVELEVKVLRGSGKGDILDQYVRFCEISDECRRKYGREPEAVREILRRCREENILVAFLSAREKEVNNIMVTLFSNEKLLELRDYHVAKEAREEGRIKGIEEGMEKGMKKGLEKGMEKGMELTLLSNLKTLMEKLGCTAQQAMDTLNVPPETRARLEPQM